jgi:hypothetical protein
MTPIDLLDFTHSKKIPAKMLKHKETEKVKISHFQVLTALMLDFMVVMGINGMISGLLKLYFSNFMISNSLHLALDNLSFYELSVSFLPFMFMSYFFFTNFFNHGQSWGMHVMKCRINIPEQNFKSSFLWAIFSSSSIMTFGLSVFWAREYFEKKGWGTFEGHDHLYVGLIQDKQLAPVNIVELSSSQENKITEEYYVEAA